MFCTGKSGKFYIFVVSLGVQSGSIHIHSKCRNRSHPMPHLDLRKVIRMVYSSVHFKVVPFYLSQRLVISNFNQSHPLLTLPIETFEQSSHWCTTLSPSSIAFYKTHTRTGRHRQTDGQTDTHARMYTRTHSHTYIHTHTYT